MGEHHHHHEHGENCTCGHHDHRHEAHVHDENCNCGQDHGHSHDHKKEHHADSGAIHVESHLHDDARVISGLLTVQADYSKLRDVLQQRLEELAAQVTTRGGIVGHIKASCEVKEVEMFSITDVTVSIKKAPVQEIRINLAAIVFIVDRAEAERLVYDTLETVRNSI